MPPPDRHARGIQRVAALWWIRLPTAVSRVSPSLGNALTDGIHLMRWPVVAALAPPAAGITGAILAASHPDPSFTSSLPLICVLASIALMSLQLGAWAWLGYSLVDFATRGEHTASPLLSEGWLRIQAASVTHAVLLATLLLGVPLAILVVRLELRAAGWPRGAAAIGEPVGAAAAAAIALALWTQATVLLVRPVFTFRGSQPSVPAVEVVQVQWPVIVGCGVVVMVLRLVIERWAVGPRVLAAIAAATEQIIAVAGSWRLPGMIAVITSAAVGTLLLSSVVAGPTEAVITFTALALLALLRNAIRGAGWLRPIAHIPLSIRFLLAIGASFGITRLVLGTVADRNGRWLSDDFFIPWLAILGAAVVVVLITAPNRPESRTASPTRSTRPGATA